MKQQVVTLLHRSQIIFHSFLSQTKFLLTTEHAHMQNVISQNLIRINLLMVFQIKLWILWKTLVYQQIENLICFMKWRLFMLIIMSQLKN